MAFRDRALIALLYRSGLRVSEALALYPKDVEGGAVRVLRGKGGRSRTVGLTPAGMPRGVDGCSDGTLP